MVVGDKRLLVRGSASALQLWAERGLLEAAAKFSHGNRVGPVQKRSSVWGPLMVHPMSLDTSPQDVRRNLQHGHNYPSDTYEDASQSSPGDLISLSPAHGAAQADVARQPADPFPPSPAEHATAHAGAHAGAHARPGTVDHTKQLGKLAGRQLARGGAGAAAKENARPVQLLVQRAAWNAGPAAHVSSTQGGPRQPAPAAALRNATRMPKAQLVTPASLRDSSGGVTRGGLERGRSQAAAVRRLSGPAAAAEASPRAGAAPGAAALAPQATRDSACSGGGRAAAASGALSLPAGQRAGQAAPAGQPVGSNAADGAAAGGQAGNGREAAAQLAQAQHQLRLKGRLVEELRAHKRQLAGDLMAIGLISPHLCDLSLLCLIKGHMLDDLPTHAKAIVGCQPGTRHISAMTITKMPCALPGSGVAHVHWEADTC